jgi:hypothetical protein
MATIYELDWNASFDPLYGAPITIPANTILWRGYDTNYPAISERYAYYSSQEIALGYAKKSKRQLGCFITTRPLQILDIRFMTVLLSRLIHTNDVHKNVEPFASMMLSFGLCSLESQIKLLLFRYKGVIDLNNDTSNMIKDGIKKLEEYYDPASIIERPGVRIAEPTNDGYTMTFLQELFKDTIDGFISPSLFTPFYVEKGSTMSPELILFNPKNSNIVQINYPVRNSIITINELIGKHHGHIVLENKKTGVKMKFFMFGGSKNMENDPIDLFNTLLEQDNNVAKEIYNRAKKEGRKWRETMVNIYKIETPTPTVPVSPFTESTI